MKISIKKAERVDLDKISGLYHGRKDTSELGWLLSDPYDKDLLNAYIAVNEEEQVVGVCGYLLSKYVYNGQILEGSIPMNWMVDPSHRGLAGISLLKKVIKLGDFGVAIGGAAMGKKIYQLVKLKKRFHSVEYYKILDPVRYFKALDHSTVQNAGKVAFLMSSYMNRNKVKSENETNIELVEFSEALNIAEENYVKDVFCKVHNKDEINYYLNCPINEGYAFSITKDKEPIGVFICFIRDRGNNIRTGQIVHLSYLGDDKRVWRDVFFKVEEFLRSKNACSITSTATHPYFTNVLKDFGYTSIARHDEVRPCYFRDLKGHLKDIPNEAFHLTFSEGDKAYRNL